MHQAHNEELAGWDSHCYACRPRGFGQTLWCRSLPFLVVLAALALVTPARPATSAVPRTHEELVAAVKKVLTEEHIPGAAIAIVQRDAEPWVTGIGKADLASSRDVTADTQFRVSSISKTFISLALLKLQEDGKVDLNARLHDVAPEVPVTNPWENSHPITLAMLLEHTAGFDDFPSGTQYQRDGKPIPLLEQTKLFRKSLVSRWPPGNRVSYTSVGYLIAGYVIEKISGVRYDDYIRGAILNPLHMPRSTFSLDLDVGSDLATGYDDNPPSVVRYVCCELWTGLGLEIVGPRIGLICANAAQSRSRWSLAVETRVSTSHE